MGDLGAAIGAHRRRAISNAERVAARDS